MQRSLSKVWATTSLTSGWVNWPRPDQDVAFAGEGSVLAFAWGCDLLLGMKVVPPIPGSFGPIRISSVAICRRLSQFAR